MISLKPNAATGVYTAICLLASCVEAPVPPNLPTIPAPSEITPAPVAQIDDYAQRFLDALQPASFAQSREYCGFFVENDGLVRGTDPVLGTAASCQSGYIPQNVVASYHTHGGYLPNYFNEVPSVDDALSSIDANLNDYVSTPGGWFWKVDGVTGTSKAICGEGCLMQDRLFMPGARDPSQNRYTLKELRRLQN